MTPLRSTCPTAFATQGRRRRACAGAHEAPTWRTISDLGVQLADFRGSSDAGRCASCAATRRVRDPLLDTPSPGGEQSPATLAQLAAASGRGAKSRSRAAPKERRKSLYGRCETRVAGPDVHAKEARFAGVVDANVRDAQAGKALEREPRRFRATARGRPRASSRSPSRRRGRFLVKASGVPGQPQDSVVEVPRLRTIRRGVRTFVARRALEPESVIRAAAGRVQRSPGPTDFCPAKKQVRSPSRSHRRWKGRRHRPRCRADAGEVFSASTHKDLDMKMRVRSTAGPRPRRCARHRRRSALGSGSEFRR